MKVELPPSAEQIRIADRIDELFSDLAAGVEALERVRKKLKRYRSAVLHAAVTGKLTEAWRKMHGPPAEPGHMLLERILVERRRQWEERTLAEYTDKGKHPPKNWQARYQEPVKPDTSNLSRLPDGWCWASVEQISTKVVDGVHKKPNYIDHGIPFVTVRNLTAGPGISFERLKYVSREDHAAFSKRTNPERGDILVTKDGTLGVTRLIETDEEFSIFVSVALVKPLFKQLAPFAALALSSPIVQAQMVPKGSGLVHIHLEDLRRDCIPLSSMAEQSEIFERAQETLSQIDAMESEVEGGFARANRLRQTILKSAFAGRLVPQDPNDEPASVLLQRIRAAREVQSESADAKQTRPKKSTAKRAARKKATKA